MWTIRLDEVEFDVRYLIGIDGLKTKIQKVEADEVDLEWTGDILYLAKWGKVILTQYSTLYDPDQPRNLAKTVTVK